MGILKTIGIIGLGVLAVRTLSSLNRASKKIDVTVSGERVGINYLGVPVVLGYIIKNPTKARMELTPPLVKIKVDGKHLASSTMSIDDIPLQSRSSEGRIKIEPFAQTEKIMMTIQIPYASILKLGLAFLTKFKDQGSKVKIEVETNAHVYTSSINLPYDDTTTIEV